MFKRIGCALGVFAVGVALAVVPATSAHAATGTLLYNLSSTWDSFCMDVPHNPPPNGDQIHTWQCQDISDQRWTYTGSIWPGGASLRGQLKAQGKCLDVPYGDYRNDVQLIVWDCHNGDNQLWARGWNSYGRWVFQAYGNTDFCIDIRYSPPGYDTPVTLGRCADITDQVWMALTSL